MESVDPPDMGDKIARMREVLTEENVQLAEELAAELGYHGTVEQVDLVESMRDAVSAWRRIYESG